MKKHYFIKLEILIWTISVLIILLSFILFENKKYLTLIASLIGVTSLIFNAKCNPFGQLLMIIFSILYGIISLNYKYYGEMITYLLMTAPMALFSLITWIKHPFKGNKKEVEIYKLTKKDINLMIIETTIITIIFYFILKYFNTTNLIFSTISVTTSYLAVYLTFKRSPYYALGYSANDIILIILWSLATMENKTYISVVICFMIFLINDLYGFINWKKIYNKQKKV